MNEKQRIAGRDRRREQLTSARDDGVELLNDKIDRLLAARMQVYLRKDGTVVIKPKEKT